MKAIIYSRTYLPGYGQGPFLNPIEIDKEGIKILMRSRARYKIVSESEEKVPPKELKKEDIVIIETNNEVAEEEKSAPIIEEIKEDVIPEDAVKKINYSEMTVEELKNLCKKNNIEFKYKDTKAALIEKLENM